MVLPESPEESKISSHERRYTPAQLMGPDTRNDYRLCHDRSAKCGAACRTAPPPVDSGNFAVS